MGTIPKYLAFGPFNEETSTSSTAALSTMSSALSSMDWLNQHRSDSSQIATSSSGPVNHTTHARPPDLRSVSDAWDGPLAPVANARADSATSP